MKNEGTIRVLQTLVHFTHAIVYQDGIMRLCTSSVLDCSLTIIARVYLYYLHLYVYTKCTRI